MAVEGTAAFGIFSDRIRTENAIETLRAAGFRTTDIFALFPDGIPTKRFTPQKRRKVLQGVATGGGVAVVVGGVLEWLVGAGIYTVGGLAALASMGAGGSFVGAWAARRVPDLEKRYEGRVRRGDILVSVHCDDLHWAKKATEILKRAGGDDVSSTSRVAEDLGITCLVSRPVNERTIASTPLRLVTNRYSERPGPGVAVSRESEHIEIKKEPMAS